MTIAWTARCAGSAPRGCERRGVRCGRTIGAHVAALVTAMAALAPVPSFAQTAGSYDRPILHIGPIEVTPRLTFNNVGIDHNVFNEPDTPKSDFTLTASPDVQLAVNPGRFRLSGGGGTELVYFKKYASQRSVNRSFVARAEANLGFFQPFVSVAGSHTNARSTSEIDVRGRHHPRSFSAGSTFKLTALATAGVSAERTSETYDEGTVFRGVDLSTTLNHDTAKYEASLGLALTSLTSVSLVVSREEMRFHSSPARDSETLRIVPTLTFSPLGLLVGTASVGYRHFNGRDAALADYSGLVASGTLGVTVLDRFRVDTIFSRDVQYSYEDRIPYYLRSGGRATVVTLIAAGLDVRVTGGRESMSYRAFAGSPAPGRDFVTTYGAGVGYRIKDHATAIVQAEFTNRGSERDHSREFKNHRVTAALNWGVPAR